MELLLKHGASIQAVTEVRRGCFRGPGKKRVSFNGGGFPPGEQLVLLVIVTSNILYPSLKGLSRFRRGQTWMGVCGLVDISVPQDRNVVQNTPSKCRLHCAKLT